MTHSVPDGQQIAFEQRRPGHCLGLLKSQHVNPLPDQQLVEGDAFNRVLMDRSRTSIRALGFFKDVEVKNAPGSAPDRTDVTVTVTEQSTGQLQLGVGYSSVSQLTGEFSYTEPASLNPQPFHPCRFAGDFFLRQTTRPMNLRPCHSPAGHVQGHHVDQAISSDRTADLHR